MNQPLRSITTSLFLPSLKPSQSIPTSTDVPLLLITLNSSKPCSCSLTKVHPSSLLPSADSKLLFAATITNINTKRPSMLLLLKVRVSGRTKLRLSCVSTGSKVSLARTLPRIRDAALPMVKLSLCLKRASTSSISLRCARTLLTHLRSARTATGAFSSTRLWTCTSASPTAT